MESSGHTGDANLHDLVFREVARLHDAFEDWFGGASRSLQSIDDALASDFTFISPRGDLVNRADLLAGLRSAHGSRSIRIRTENTAVLWRSGDVVMACYQEWHDHDDYTTTRQASVLFALDTTAPGGLRWQHVHETWVTPPPNWVVPERVT